MEQHVRAPDPLPNKEPMDKTWKMWKQEFNIFLRASGFDKKDNEDKAYFLMNKVGKVGLEAMQEMKFDNEEEKQDFDILLQKFDDYFDPPKRETEERFKFYSRSKKNNESIEAYIADLKEKAKTCNFGDLSESLVRDMVILDIKDKNLRKMMFEEKELDIQKLILIYKQWELNTEKIKDITKKVTSESDNKPKDSSASDNKSPNLCWRCGTSHPPRTCPAFKSECNKCKEKGHFTQRCCNKSSSGNANNPNLNKNANKNKNYTKNPFNQTEKNKTNN